MCSSRDGRHDLNWHADGMSTPLAKQDLEREYRLYNAACNAHEFDRLAEFVAQNVVLNGETHGLQA